MSGSSAELSNVLAHVARAVFTTQQELDNFADQSLGDLPFVPLSFVVKQTQVILLGNLSLPRSAWILSQERALTFSLINRVERSLRGPSNTLTSRISVLIEAVEPFHGDQKPLPL